MSQIWSGPYLDKQPRARSESITFAMLANALLPFCVHIMAPFVMRTCKVGIDEKQLAMTAKHANTDSIL
eukprot:1286309-Karenia_brevis.AAC.1